MLERASFGIQDRELIAAFTDHLSAIGASNKRLSKYIFHLKVTGENFPTGFKETERKGDERFMSWLRQHNSLCSLTEDEKKLMQILQHVVLVSGILSIPLYDGNKKYSIKNSPRVLLPSIFHSISP